ncbi:MAG: cache domain-containing protein [Campylobacterales bacterium]|nr:cache domain-containing protein [Campylobacterales bacterium]
MIGKVTKQPLVSMVSPILDENKTVIGIVSGTRILDSKDFLSGLSSEKYGRHGKFYIVSLSDGIFIDKDVHKVSLKKLATSHEGKMFEQVLQKEKASIITIDENKEEILLSSVKFGKEEWLLAVTTPTKEIFEPIEKTTDKMSFVVLISSIFIMLLTWLVLHILLNPLKKVSNKLK